MTDQFNSGELEINNQNYNNQNVMEIMNNLGPFDYATGCDDGEEKGKRPIIMLENGAKYEGEWLKNDDVR